MKKYLLFLIIVFSIIGKMAVAADGDTLKAVKERGILSCGVSNGQPGLSYIDKDGVWQGLDVDICRVIAAAIFGDPKKVSFVPLSAKERLVALQTGEIDVLSRNTTWTYTRDTNLGLDFTAIIYYDGAGFMVRKADKIDSIKQLDGATICVQTGTTTEVVMADYFKKNGLKYKPLVFEKNTETFKAYDTGRCDAITTDTSGLVANRATLKDPKANYIIPETISKEPLGPVVREGDSKWKDLVTWVIFGIINADEYGVTSKNIDSKKNSDDQNIQALLGVKGFTLNKYLGVDKDWLYNAVKKVGNYKEIFDRAFIEPGLLQDPGLNKLWSEGGLVYAPPLR